MKSILICPKCAKKLYIFKERPKHHDLVKVDNVTPFSKEIPQPKPHEKAKCFYCNAELIFDDLYLIER